MITYNPHNRVKALKLIKELKQCGIISSEISRGLGRDIWFISGIETKGTNVSDATLAGLRNMVNCKQTINRDTTLVGLRGNGHVTEITIDDAILALLQSGKTLSSQDIMRKLLSKYRVGTISKALTNLKLANKIESPQRGYYCKRVTAKLTPIESHPWDYDNGKSEITKLRKEIRSLRKLTKRILHQAKLRNNKKPANEQL